jgi:hypothetical protein
MASTLPRQVLRFVASIAVVVLLSSIVAPQKPAPSSPNSQAKLEEKVNQLETELKEAEQKAASAAMEKDYITRVQKQYESYYREVLSTQTWTLGIFGLILTALLVFAGVFSFNVFDSRTKSALDAALAQVEKKFNDQMQKELETLRQQNSSRLEALGEGLKKQISEQELDLKIRSDFQFQCAQGIATGLGERYDQARNSFRLALRLYKHGKPRKLFDKGYGVTTVENIFHSFESEDKANYQKNTERELADPLYDGLEDELALAAVPIEWLGPLLKERKPAPSPTAAAKPKTGEAQPIEALPAPAPKAEK